MTCSECGYTAKRERKLYKARRRWKLAFLGAFMLLGAYALNVTPAVKDRGWPAAVPMSAKILMQPLMRPSHENITKYFNGWWVTPTNPGFDDLGIHDRLFLGLLDDYRHHGRNKTLRPWHLRLQRAVAPRHLVSHEFADIEWPVSMHLALATARWRDRTPEDWASITPVVPLQVRAETRAKWPRGVPLRIWLTIDGPREHRPSQIIIESGCGTKSREIVYSDIYPPRGSRTWLDETIELWPIEDAEHDLNVSVQFVQEQSMRFVESDSNPIRRRMVWRKQPLLISVDIVDDISTILEPVRDEQFSSLLIDLARPELQLTLSPVPRSNGSRYAGTLEFVLGGRDSDLSRRAELTPLLKQFTFAVQLEIRADREIVGGGRFWISHDFPWLPLKHHPYGSRGIRYDAHDFLSFMFVPFEMDPQWRMTNENRNARWTLILRGDAETALRNLTSHRYWCGEVELPLSLDGTWFVMPERGDNVTPPSHSHPDTHPESR